MVGVTSVEERWCSRGLEGQSGPQHGLRVRAEMSQASRHNHTSAAQQEAPPRRGYKAENALQRTRKCPQQARCHRPRHLTFSAATPASSESASHRSDTAPISGTVTRYCRGETAMAVSWRRPAEGREGRRWPSRHGLVRPGPQEGSEHKQHVWPAPASPLRRRTGPGPSHPSQTWFYFRSHLLLL